MPEFMRDAEFWVAVAFVIVIAGLFYKLRGTATTALDERAALDGVRQVAIEVTRAAATKLTGSAIDDGRAAAAVDAAMRERA